MTGLAGSREADGAVIGIRRAVELRRVAAKTVGGDALKTSIHVTRCALDRHMRSGQAKARQGVVVEACALPLVQRMARLAVGTNVRRAVIERRCGLVVQRMTGHAGRAQPAECPAGGASVTGLAVRCGMRSHQRKPVGMPLHALDLHVPSSYGVAILTGDAELPPVYVGVAGRTCTAHIREDRFHMTAHATDSLMPAEKREACLHAVIEVRETPDGFP
jgi:hypothetical protein